MDDIRETIRHKTPDQYGSHIPTTAAGYLKARLDCIRKVQKGWDTKEGKHTGTLWEPPKPPNFHLLAKSQKDSGRKNTIDAKYRSMEKEVQINFVNELSVIERARLAAHLALVWYEQRNSKGTVFDRH